MQFSESERLLERALKVIPNGTQTFSKSKTQYPVGASPLFAVRGKGSHVWDVDGNEYVDFVSGLTPLILGYCDPDVDTAVMEQMKDGVIFSLPHLLEVEVSELICSMVPCAEMVRFGKNGSDATAGAVRLTRYHTRRDLIATNGYHGWHDEFNGITVRNGGVPQAVRALTKEFQYNDIDSLHRIFKDNPGQVACVILEPMNSIWPKNGFLQEVKELTRKNGAILIFDEVITGFRFALGGAQEYFGVTPDLACFGKAIANGYPLSAIAGKAEIMRDFEKIHFSFTNAGECLSLAACKATLSKVRGLDVPRELGIKGTGIRDGLQDKVSGHPSWLHWRYSDQIEKAKIIQEFIGDGILSIGTFNLNLSHSWAEIVDLAKSFKRITDNILDIELKGQPVERGVR